MPRRAAAPDFVHAAGSDLTTRLEHHPDPAQIDHLWIGMDTGGPDRMTVSVNTQSKRNLDAGFDARIRVGILRGTWRNLPPRGVSACRGFDYADLERGTNIYYEHHDRTALEKLLQDSVSRAILLDAWGTPYHHKRLPGLHQIHSRRASRAVPVDITNRDGALQFYFSEDQATALFLFKFCGQP
jgi:hypothetical protein